MTPHTTSMLAAGHHLEQPCNQLKMGGGTSPITRLCSSDSSIIVCLCTSDSRTFHQPRLCTHCLQQCLQTCADPPGCRVWPENASTDDHLLGQVCTLLLQTCTIPARLLDKA